MDNPLIREVTGPCTDLFKLTGSVKYLKNLLVTSVEDRKATLNAQNYLVVQQNRVPNNLTTD